MFMCTTSDGNACGRRKRSRKKLRQGNRPRPSAKPAGTDTARHTMTVRSAITTEFASDSRALPCGRNTRSQNENPHSSGSLCG